LHGDGVAAAAGDSGWPVAKGFETGAKASKNVMVLRRNKQTGLFIADNDRTFFQTHNCSILHSNYGYRLNL
jgi:hypothetical protein